MSIIKKVENVNQAVELALKWKKQGKYDWFRGQTHLWDITPSAARNTISEKELSEKVKRYLFWLQTTAGLEYLSNDVNAAMAVAQHYSIPTTFVDFTTNPKIAGFFASDGENLKIGQDCCIYCLNTKDLAEFWETICKVSPEYPMLDFIKLNVKDLWRLQAQEGVFLYCPLPHLERIYDIDKIVFPYTGNYDIPRESIYPKRKSRLEIQLDQFFAAEKGYEGFKVIQEMANKTGIKIRDTSNNETNERYLYTNKLSILNSWEEVESDWIRSKGELWKNVSSSEVWEFTISLKKSVIQIQSEIQKDLTARFIDVNNYRSKLIDWAFHIEESSIQAGNPEFEMQQVVRRIFDGMRTLPYTDTEIAESISKGIALTVLWLQSGLKKINWRWENIFLPLIPDLIEIEFSSYAGGASRGFTSRKKLFSCLRDDIEDLIKPEFRQPFLEDIVPVIQFITEPKKLYDFQKLKKVFVEDLIPTQAVIRDLKSPLYFSPAGLSFLGIP